MNAGQWVGVFAGHVWMLSQTNDCVLYKSFCTELPSRLLVATTADRGSASNHSISEQCVNSCEKHVDHSMLLHDYFQLSVNLQELYADWGQRGHCISFYTHFVL